MRDEVMSQFTGGHWLTAALAIFLIVFVVFVVWTYRRSAKRYYEQMGRLPFDEGDDYE